jgi:hypothetical protein
MIHGKSYIPLDFTAMAPGMLLNPASGHNGGLRGAPAMNLPIVCLNFFCDAC